MYYVISSSPQSTASATMSFQQLFTLEVKKLYSFRRERRRVSCMSRSFPAISSYETFLYTWRL